MNSVLEIPSVSKVTATELKENLSLYLSKASDEDIAITSHGKVVAVLISPIKEKVKIGLSLRGILPSDIDADALLKERLMKI